MILSSTDPWLQLAVFKKIVFYSIKFPAGFLLFVKNSNELRDESIDALTYSWKRPGVEYSVQWLYYYRLVARCLSTRSSPVITTAAQFDSVYWHSANNSYLEDVLRCCE